MHWWWKASAPKEWSPGSNLPEESVFPQVPGSMSLWRVSSLIFLETAFKICSVWLCCGPKQWYEEKACSDSLKQCSQASSKYSKGMYTLLKLCLICSAVLMWDIWWDGEMRKWAKKQEKQWADRSKSRKAVPGAEGDLLSNIGSPVATTCLQVVGRKQTLLWDA